MKRTILILTVLIFGIKSNSQPFEHNFLGEDFLQYKGVLFILKKDLISNYAHTFYADLKYCQSAFDNNVIYPNSTYTFNTEKDSLINRVFIVENIIDKNGTTWDNKVTKSYSDKPIIVLKDTLTKQIIYYMYDEKYEHNFAFNTSKILYDEKVYCSKVERTVDDFTGEIKVRSPISSGGKISSMIIYKNINKGRTVYYLSLRTYGSTVNTNESGVVILFTDGTKWARQTKIDVDAESSGFEYSAFTTLTPADLITFSTKKIKKFRLYIYDEEVNSSDAEKFKLFVKCVKQTK